MRSPDRPPFVHDLSIPINRHRHDLARPEDVMYFSTENNAHSIIQSSLCPLIHATISGRE
jgi:hypothetical protein